MLRNIIAGVVGVMVAVGLVWVIEIASHTVYPPPPGLDFTDTEALGLYVAGLPAGAFAFIGGAWFIGTLGGTLIACYIGNAAPRTYAVIVGTLILVATAINLAMIPHPLWFAIAGITGILVAAWLGMLIGNRTRHVPVGT